MKRLCALLLIGCLLLSGCSGFAERIKEPVTFYYLRSEYLYFIEDGVIASEQREASGHRDDLSYLLSLYLMGPSEESLVSPLPKSIRILKTEQSDTGIVLQLSDTSNTMDDIAFSLAGACLALTCFDLTDADTVSITSGERTLTLGRDTLLLYDSSATAAEE